MEVHATDLMKERRLAGPRLANNKYKLGPT